MPARRVVCVLTCATLSVIEGCGGATTSPSGGDATGIDVFSRGADLLTWNQTRRVAAFPAMDTIFPSHVVRRGASVHDLPVGPPLNTLLPTPEAERALTDFIASQNVAGLLILVDGKIRLERYALGQTASSRWTSFSVAKSLTSLLVGAAIKDGYISGPDALVTTYIPELKGSAYEGVTVRHLLTMTSGVAFNEDYSDPNSDIVRFTHFKLTPGIDANVSFVRTLKREAPPGTKWVYKTPETNLIGTLVIAATGRPLATYLSEKIWAPYGMDHDATWLVDHVGHEQGGCCIQATLRDYARFGQYMLDAGLASGSSIVPAGWVTAATRTQFQTGVPGTGYGYLWWTSDGGPFEARGIYGQLIHIDPARQLVVVVSGAWNDPLSATSQDLQRQLVTAIGNAVDAERAAH
jgi:CubicO group peptidase (beta-lactamase class C family)